MRSLHILIALREVWHPSLKSRPAAVIDDPLTLAPVTAPITQTKTNQN
jgi:hypothetical protein